ncbi:hypothetical protein IQ07DRAFT_585016 [Pyrenochaeta sp. DS3sAY3a]|nr:hypothetical protein IQ07DRAFT_585016 [Pyrenochaeta sp. DS3sAY3a]
MDQTRQLFFGQHRELLERLGDGEPSTTEEADALIESIRISKGYLDEDIKSDLQKLDARTREVMLQFVARQREIEAAFTKSVSGQLYSSKYRFLFELIQNADDSFKRQTTAVRGQPYLRFIISNKTFIVESNEAGFTRANVEAICATGKSSKKATAADDQIGEKGLGFKSVFSVAKEVHVQSGVWSFRFQHNPRDDGLGMVTPLHAPQEALGSGVGTRITLQLADQSASAYQKLLDAVSEIPKTTIMYLQQLEKIEISMERTDGRSETINITKTASSLPYATRITRSQTLDRVNKLDVSTFLRFAGGPIAMPEDDRRKNRKEAEVKLAFPVNTNSMKPEISENGQYLFAYLPVQRLPQIPFLIQADFITSASRETIDMDCPWNEVLRDNIVAQFANVVSKFFAKSDHFLRYSWPDYLPKGPMDQLWKPLYSMIVEKLQSRCILQSWESRQFKIPSQLRKLPERYLYDSQPILRDLQDNRYLAPEYESRHLGILADLGATSGLTPSDIVDRVQADLVRMDSRVKVKDPQDQWHEAFATLMVSCLRDSDSDVKLRIRRLTLIPLTGFNQWTGAPGIRGGQLSIYFPTTESIPIPETIGLSLVSQVAASSKKRRDLFAALGVQECLPSAVLAKIESYHCLDSSARDLNQLRYLFHFHPKPELIAKWVRLLFDSGQIELATAGSIYFPSTREYDMYQLLPENVRKRTDTQIRFLPQNLVEFVSPIVRVREKTWKDWLQDITMAQHHPALVSYLGTFLIQKRLSREMKAILLHNPTKFVGTLQAHWTHYQRSAFEISDELRACMVPCQNGTTSRLSSTYLPTAEILPVIELLELPSSAIPILKLPVSTLDDATYSEWQFLERFGVTSKPNLEFYKLALKALKVVPSGGCKAEDVYKLIAGLATIQDYESLRSFFDTGNYICDADTGFWRSRKDCLWEAPGFIKTKSVLSRTHGNSDDVKTLFSNILGIPDWTIDDIIAEIEHLRDDSVTSPKLPIAQSIYAFLHSNTNTEQARTELKTRFKEKRLVLGENDTWHTLETCLWQTAFQLSGHQDLSRIFPTLEAFFVRQLRVKRATPSLLIKEIKRMATETQPRIPEIRERLVGVGMLLSKTSIDAAVETALDELKEVAFLPKKQADGASILVKVTDDFAIPDHPRYATALAGKDALLDFEWDEVSILQVIFRYLRLTGRYLSAMAREVSTVGDDAVEDVGLSQQLNVKAYALFCCAAKFKSQKALRGDRALFDQLSTATVLTTNDIRTNIVIQLGPRVITAENDRLFLHHTNIDQQLKIYVPADQEKRRQCYKYQMHILLASILGVYSTAQSNIQNILTSHIGDIDEVFQFQDIPSVDWVEKPVVVVPETQAIEPPMVTPVHSPIASVFNDSRAPTVVGDDIQSTGLADNELPRATLVHGANAAEPNDLRAPTVIIEEVQTTARAGNYRDYAQYTPVLVTARTVTPEPDMSQYARLIQQVVRLGQRAGSRLRNPGVNEAHAATHEERLFFGMSETFGIRNNDPFAHDMRIGAVGEAYVFELLLALQLPSFSPQNWQSTIRSVLSCAAHYRDLGHWSGRETSDIVYTDRHGHLTRVLRRACTGGFPAQIGDDHDHAAQPIEYYIEVKSTTSDVGQRFFVSPGQYDRIADMALRDGEAPRRVYVIMRVYELTSGSVGVKMFVDPLRLRGRYLEFEVQQWIGKVL